jgi:hypothetical protein
LITGIAGVALAAGAAAASADNNAAYSGNASSSDYMSTFRLNNTMSTEVLSYSRPRELRICNSTQHATSRRDTRTATPYPSSHVIPATPLVNRPVPSESNRSAPVALQITYSGMTDQVQPGECYSINARRVTIASVGALTAGSALNGTVEWVNPNAPLPYVNVRASANGESDHEMIRQMTHRLEQDERTMRAATMELDRARDELVAATRDMRKAQMAANRKSGQELHEANSGQNTATTR